MIDTSLTLAGIYVPSTSYSGLFAGSCRMTHDACNDLSAETCSTDSQCTTIATCQTDRCDPSDQCCALDPLLCSLNPACDGSGFECMPAYDDCGLDQEEAGCGTGSRAHCKWDATAMVRAGNATRIAPAVLLQELILRSHNPACSSALPCRGTCKAATEEIPDPLCLRPAASCRSAACPTWACTPAARHKPWQAWMPAHPWPTTRLAPPPALPATTCVSLRAPASRVS